MNIVRRSLVGAVVLLAACAMPSASHGNSAVGSRPFSVNGYYVEACSCMPPCSCEFTGPDMTALVDGWIALLLQENGPLVRLHPAMKSSVSLAGTATATRDAWRAAGNPNANRAATDSPVAGAEHDHQKKATLIAPGNRCSGGQNVG